MYYSSKFGIDRERERRRKEEMGTGGGGGDLNVFFAFTANKNWKIGDQS